MSFNIELWLLNKEISKEYSQIIFVFTFKSSEHPVLNSGNAEIATKIVHANSIITAGAGQAENFKLP